MVNQEHAGQSPLYAFAVLQLSGDPEADRLLSEDPFALLIGMVLDQQVPLERAFSSPRDLKERLGGKLDAAEIASMDPAKLAGIFSERPALHRFPAFTASVCNLRPTSRGSVEIVSRFAADAPRIAPCYLSTADDRKVAADALRLTRHIVSMPALAPYEPVEYLPGPQYQTDEELAVAAGMVGTTIFHPIGTCRMGRADDADAVVDARLRVRGISGLRVIDASIMPTITSGNTNAPTMMIAEKGAEMIRADRRNEAAVQPERKRISSDVA